MSRLLILILVTCHTVALANKATVSSTDDLRAMLANPSPGDTIFLNNGIYIGPFEIPGHIIIIGHRGAVLDGNHDGDALLISGDSVEIHGVTIRNSGDRLLKDMAGIKITGNDAVIDSCLVKDSLHGIYVKGGNRIRIRGNIIEGRRDKQESDRGNGIHLWNTKLNIIENNDIGFARDGIYFSFANETTVTGNHIHDLRYGLHYMYSDDNLFEDNLFDHNVAGSALMYSENIIFRRNIFAHCRGFRAYGILLQSVNNCQAADNLILDNSKAIFVDDSNNNLFKSNDIVQNDLAAQINASCEGNSFIGNNFISNLSAVIMDASIITDTHFENNGRGNYWSDYAGYDLDSDGVGDVPHSLQNVFEYLESDDPAVRFYLYSPASQLLTAAEKRLPILRRTRTEDRYPLFKPIENSRIPWPKMTALAGESSYIHAMLWTFLIILPVGLMLGLRR